MNYMSGSRIAFGIVLLCTLTTGLVLAAEPDTTSTLISDVAMLKFLLLDRGSNIVAMGWGDRDDAKCGLDRIDGLIEGVISRYGYNVSGEDFYLDVFGLRGADTLSPEEVDALVKRISEEVLDMPLPTSWGGTVDEDGCSMSLSIQDRAYRLVVWPEESELPDIKYGPGTMRFTFDSKTMSFSDGAKCVFNERTYVYGSGVWGGE